MSDTLGAVLMEALAELDKLREAGSSPTDRLAALESILRDRWPKPYDRTTPWRYICEDCGDTGFQRFVCRPGCRCNGISTRTDGPGSTPKYNRLCVGSTDYEHEYGEPCLCVKGGRFRPRERGGVEDFTTAVKSKPKPMTRFGR